LTVDLTPTPPLPETDQTFVRTKIEKLPTESEAAPLATEFPGRYALKPRPGTEDAELGRGGIGRVLAAWDSHLGREIALKELLKDPGETGTRGSARAQRFLREARVT